MSRRSLWFLCWLLCPYAFADVSSDLGQFFEGLGMTSNVTAPAAYPGQQAGYYSGGSLFARSSVRNVQLVQVDLPSYRSGCGGIDLFAGGFSFINNDELVKTMRNVLNNAKGYAFTLTLEEVTPQIANAMKYMQDMANKVNQSNINSCESAEALVGGVWPRTRQAAQQVCQDVGTTTGVFEDWAKARQGCTSTDGSYNGESTLQAGANDPRYKNLILDNGNLAWKALQANNLTAGDKEFAELLMSLSGSVIMAHNGAGKDAGNQFTVLASLASDPSLLKALLYGDKATLYQCDEPEQCLHPRAHTVTISAEMALKNHVASLLRAIADNIRADKPLTPPQIGLLQATRIPIYKVLNVQAAYQKDPSLLDVESYADVIASDLLFQYLQENLALVRSASASLQFPTDILATFQEGIATAMSAVRAEQRHAQVQVSQAMQLIEQSQVIEQMLAGQLSVQLGNSLTWARSLR